MKVSQASQKKSFPHSHLQAPPAKGQITRGLNVSPFESFPIFERGSNSWPCPLPCSKNPHSERENTSSHRHLPSARSQLAISDSCRATTAVPPARVLDSSNTVKASKMREPSKKSVSALKRERRRAFSCSDPMPLRVFLRKRRWPPFLQMFSWSDCWNIRGRSARKNQKGGKKVCTKNAWYQKRGNRRRTN